MGSAPEEIGAQILDLLGKAGVRVVLDGVDLVARPTPAVTPDIVGILRENKAAVIVALRRERGLKRAAARGLVANWSGEFGYVSIHDPTTGEWWDVPTKEAPPWAVTEARKRKDLRRAGNRKAFRLTRREMEEIWEAEHPDLIVEDHPLEGA